ncbi:hypothetical protein CHRYSEO8AT_270071 [Chryseobacterium sp. 8AT]|nr:hypothetical protein CHRYSEO8AT_270071 [Chryseobacterium sp. 8AT]
MHDKSIVHLDYLTDTEFIKTNSPDVTRLEISNRTEQPFRKTNLSANSRCNHE